MNGRRMTSILYLIAVCGICFWLAGGEAHPAPVQWEVNGHWYDAIELPSTWFEAFIDARKHTYQTHRGHLASLTSQEENDFVWQHFPRELFWLGAFQVPRATRVDEGWVWITREPWYFTNWDTGNREPDDGGDQLEDRPGEEDFLQFHFTYTNGQWNDIWNNYVAPGYIIEYGRNQNQLMAPIGLERVASGGSVAAVWAGLKQSP